MLDFPLPSVLLRFTKRFHPVTEANSYRYLAVVVSSCLWLYAPIPSHLQGYFRQCPPLGWGIVAGLGFVWFLVSAKFLGLMAEHIKIGTDRGMERNFSPNDFSSYNKFEAAYNNPKPGEFVLGSFLKFVLANALEILVTLRKLGSFDTRERLVSDIGARVIITELLENEPCCLALQKTLVFLLRKLQSPNDEFLKYIFKKARQGGLSLVEEKVRRMVSTGLCDSWEKEDKRVLVREDKITDKLAENRQVQGLS